jgi:UDP-N-acetyl-D-glucosamine dehydrogenase
MTTPASKCEQKILTGTALIGVIGIGYVGLPLATACGRAEFKTVGFDIDSVKTARINAGQSYVDAVTSEEMGALVATGMLSATTDFSGLSGCDVIVICVPTPLTRQREPDLSYIASTCSTIAQQLRPGQLVVLESTTYPGTTTEIMKPILEQSGLIAGRDFFVGFSPEREDPGNTVFRTVDIPKIVAGDGPEATKLVQAFYGKIVKKVVAVSAPNVAEAIKLTENVFRAVNIALVNELKVIYEAMGIDIWEVIDAASTKPFGYMPFYPGPGLGGHCIPIDPFYLTWKAREFDITTRFIELAGEINSAMPLHVTRRLEEGLDKFAGKSLGSSQIVLLGLAYKKNIGDVRESPSFKLMEILDRRGASVLFHDPYVPETPAMRDYPKLAHRKSVPLTKHLLRDCDAVLLATDHDDIDYALVAEEASLIVDTRNAFARRGLQNPKIIKA